MNELNDKIRENIAMNEAKKETNDLNYKENR